VQAAEPGEALEHEGFLQDIPQLFATGAAHDDIDVAGLDAPMAAVGSDQQVAEGPAHQVGGPSGAVKLPGDFDNGLLDRPNGIGIRGIPRILARGGHQPGETPLKKAHQLNFCKLPHDPFTTFSQGRCIDSRVPRKGITHQAPRPRVCDRNCTTSPRQCLIAGMAVESRSGKLIVAQRDNCAVLYRANFND